MRCHSLPFSPFLEDEAEISIHAQYSLKNDCLARRLYVGVRILLSMDILLSARACVRIPIITGLLVMMLF